MRWWRLRCRHLDTYRERRPLPGTTLLVWHLVCPQCQHARPMMHRTTDEHAEIVAHRPITTKEDPCHPK